MSAGQGTARVGLRDAKTLRYVARQPIFDCEQNVFGYELLFRNSLENCFVGDADEASRATLDRSLLMGLDVLCDGRRAFVNCTRDTLIKGLVTLLPSTSTIVEILETVPSDPEVMAACQSLKQQGYMIALDDYVAGDRRAPLAEMADIIKVDLQLTTEEQREELIKQFGPWRCRMLAEKVETQGEFAQARDQGFVYFQGYFFRAARNDEHARYAGKPAELCAHAAGSIAPAAALAESRRPDQGRGIDLLPPVTVSELRCVWLPQRNPLGTARLVVAGRARSAAMGAGDCRRSRWAR